MGFYRFPAGFFKSASRQEIKTLTNARVSGMMIQTATGPALDDTGKATAEPRSLDLKRQHPAK